MSGSILLPLALMLQAASFGLGAGALKDVVRNPFRFFALNNRAAEMNGGAPVLSSKAMAYLESLERQYTKGRIIPG